MSKVTREYILENIPDASDDVIMNILLDNIECNKFQLRLLNKIYSQRLDASQLAEIHSAMRDNLDTNDLNILCDKRFSADQMYQLRSLARDKPSDYFSIDFIADNRLSPDVMREIRMGMTKDHGFDPYRIEKFIRPVFNTKQMHQIVLGASDYLSENDIRIFAKPELTPEQMREIRLGLEHKLPANKVNSYASSDISDVDMRNRRIALEHDMKYNDKR